MIKIVIGILWFIYKIKSEVYFEEEFYDESYTNRWIESNHKGIDQGKFQLSSGKNFGDMWRDTGLQTSQNSKFYGISAKFEEPFNTKDKILVIQYQIKMEEPIECGGGYIKILGSGYDPKNFHGHTPYKIMFGPDICGADKRMVHVIINYNEKYFLIKKDITCKDDKFSHLYTLVIYPNNTYNVLIDNKKVEGGNLDDDFDFLPPKKIQDPNASKPEDWVDEEKVNDENDTKPDNWDQSKTIPDPHATKPKDYDEETYGPWEPPIIDNPNYKGEWEPRQIDNPNYKGKWIHPLINNPNFEPDPQLYVQYDLGGLGFDIWQVIAGSIFDNILITDDPDYASAVATSTWNEVYDDEMKIFKHQEDNVRKQKEEFKAFSEKPSKDSDDADEDNEDEIIDDSMIKSPKVEL